MKEASNLSSKLSISSNVPSICTTINTSVLNSKCLTNVSLTNSSNQTRDQTPFLIRPDKPQKIKRQNTITVEPSHNVSTNSPQSPHNSNTCSTNERNQTPCPSYYTLWVSYSKPQSKQKKKKKTCLGTFTRQSDRGGAS